jgi:AcrR family transcriptional regulator
MTARVPYRKAFRPPQQVRSKATMDRFLTAAMALLVERRFQEASVQDIVKRAKSSVGAFYTRFPDKNALMLYVHQEVYKHANAVSEALLDPARWANASTYEIVAGLVQSLVERRKEHAPLIRALVLHARSSPDLLALAAESNRHFHQLVQTLLAPRHAEMTHPDPERAIAVGLHAVDTAAREAILYSEAGLGPPETSDRDLSTELTRMFVAYLGIEPSSAKPRTRRRS